jgi:DNA-directed RNA polymerase subunit RPC12/RpoP
MSGMCDTVVVQAYFRPRLEDVLNRKTSWSAWAYWNWQKYRQLYAHECVTADGAWRCPKCRSRKDPDIIADATQYGFEKDRVTEFVKCSECQYRMAVITFIDKE